MANWLVHWDIRGDIHGVEEGACNGSLPDECTREIALDDFSLIVTDI